MTVRSSATARDARQSSKSATVAQVEAGQERPRASARPRELRTERPKSLRVARGRGDIDP